ncbi:MAG TPA: T9SS type A sorting domain-containing protein [Caldithrix sp.]|nr:T9SS type A sorting domain-containing protein [Caldithrix sp.]
MKELLLAIFIYGLFAGLWAQTIPDVVITKLKDPDFNQRYNWCWVDDATLEITAKYTGLKKMYDVFDQGSLEEAMAGVNQVIDLTNIDTTLYAHKYTYWKTIPFGGRYGDQVIVSDMDNDGFKEVVGQKVKEYPEWGINSMIGEFEADSSFSIKHIYEDSTSHCIGSSPTDLDQDGLLELSFRYNIRKIRNYESMFSDSFPEIENFTYMDTIDGSETVVDLDQDGLKEVLYVGSDMAYPGYEIFLAEYEPAMNNFHEVYLFNPFYYVYDFAVGDHDSDGLMDFAVGDMIRRFYVIEHTGIDNSYSLVFEDTISAPNAFLNASTNDIDNNGKPEFFIGGVGYYGGMGATKVYWLEADGDNHYQKIRTFFLLGTNVIGNTFLYNWDVDADGKDELVFTFDPMIVILKYTGNGLFEIFYVKKKNGSGFMESVTGGYLLNSSKPELLISNSYLGTSIYHVKTDIYRYNNPNLIISDKNQLTHSIQLQQNFPNPFNNHTQINFLLNHPGTVSLVIYNITGREVTRLVDNIKLNPGNNSVPWDGKNQKGKEVSSGIYLYELRTGIGREVKKMLFIK